MRKCENKERVFRSFRIYEASNFAFDKQTGSLGVFVFEFSNFINSDAHNRNVMSPDYFRHNNKQR